jgi:hypothetical protein
MALAFKSTDHEHTYQHVVSSLKEIGYRGQLLQERYPFGDWFLPERPQREAPIAAFGRFPPSYDSACFAVLVPNGVAGKPLVSQYRALGAPLALEVEERQVTVWRVGHDEGATAVAEVIPSSRLSALFQQNREKWSADSILRAKNIGVSLGPQQRDLFDLHLIPALEEQIRDKLHVFLNEVLDRTKQQFRRQTGAPPDEKLLFRLVFRLLAAKVLHDRNVPDFADMGPDTGASRVLQEVSRFYHQTEPILEDEITQQAALDLLWEQVSFQNLSVEVLAYVYENTLVSKSTRQRLGTHSTPSSVARYLVNRLPFEDTDRNDRVVVEPCCGHAVFLVAALQRLRQLLPAGMNSSQRHPYLVRMLRGFEIDAFALEVGKLCLMLADFPNADGWRLENEDVFASPAFTASLGEARFVLANPPFEDFSAEERGRYGDLRSVRKPAELLYRVLAHIHPQACLGFVLPRQFIDGTGYEEIRKTLAERFGEVDIVALPDRVFHVSKAESSLLIAKRPRAGGEKTAVCFTEVADRDREGFLKEHAFTRQDTLMRTIEEAEESLAIEPLWDVWEHLRDGPRLSRFADIHRGIEWKHFDEDVCYSPVAKEGYRRGYTRIRESPFAFQPQQTEYLNVTPANLLYSAIRRPWNTTKVILNAARISRGPWRLAAFVDHEDNVASQRFHGIWPSGDELTVECLAAILNGPIANTYVAAHERGRDNQKRTIAEIPIPRPEALDQAAIAQAVSAYVRAVNAMRDTLIAEAPALLYELLLRIDALVLKGYDLPPRLELKVLKYLEGCKRPVPFEFTQFDVKKLVTMRITGGGADYRSEWERKRSRRDELAQKYLDDSLDEGEDEELQTLDRDLDRFIDTVTPLPFDQLDQLEQLARVSGLLDKDE